MSKIQVVVVISSIILLASLYGLVRTKPSNHTQLEKTRQLTTQQININEVLTAAYKKLNDYNKARFDSLQTILETSREETLKLETLKRLSSEWNKLGSFSLGGFFAEQVASLSNTEDSWAIAGTTYAICLQKSQDSKVKEFCFKQSVTALENAISINPTNISHRINLALCYVESPPKTEPMKGVMMLLNLNRQHPDNVSVLTNLGRLAIKTGQYEKAKQRLSKALKLNPEHKEAQELFRRLNKLESDTTN